MRSPLATSASRLSLHGAAAGIIPASLMGHGAPERADERDEPVVPAAEIDGLGGEYDLHAGAEAQHARADADTIAARCSGLTAPRNVIRAPPTSTKTSRSDSGPAGTALAADRTTTGSSRGFLPVLSRAFFRNCDRHQISVRSFTP